MNARDDDFARLAADPVKNTMRTVIVYHAGCWDGFCAAWVLRWKYPNAEFHAAHYGAEPPDVTGARVVIADFCYKRPVMRRIMSAAHSVVVLDHHKTAEAELAGIVDEFMMRPDLIANPPGSELPTVWFDMTKSGGRLAWEWINRDGANGDATDSAPWLVDYTEDRDLWRHALPFSREINAALRSYPLDFNGWDAMARRDPVEWLVPEGRALLRHDAQVVDQHVRHAREIELAGYKVLAVNATVLFSEIAGKLAEGRPFGACYFDRGDGLRQWSLRSDAKGVDVSEVAVRLGGGGHKNSAGFEEQPPTVSGGGR